MTCSKHPRYQGKRFPRSGCDQCFLVYMEKHPDLTADLMIGGHKSPPLTSEQQRAVVGEGNYIAGGTGGHR